MTSSRLPIGVAQTASAIATRVERLERDEPRADRRPRRPELGAHDADGSRPRRQRLAQHHLARRLEQELSGGLAEAAADHDHLGVEDVDERADARSRAAGPSDAGSRAPASSPSFARSDERWRVGGRAEQLLRVRGGCKPRQRTASRWPRPVQQPWHGRPSCSITMCPSSAAARAAAVGTPVEDQPAADAGAEREHEHVARAACPRRRATRRSRRRSRRCRSRPAAPNRSPIRSRSGDVGRAGCSPSRDAVPVALVDLRRNAEAERGDVVVARARRSSSRSPSSDVLLRRDRRRRLAVALDRAVAVDEAGEDLRPAEVDADDAVRLQERADNITAAWPSGEKPYRVYRGGRHEGKGSAAAARRRRRRARRRPTDGPVTPARPGPSGPSRAAGRAASGSAVVVAPAPGARLGRRELLLAPRGVDGANKRLGPVDAADAAELAAHLDADEHPAARHRPRRTGAGHEGRALRLDHAHPHRPVPAPHRRTCRSRATCACRSPASATRRSTPRCSRRRAARDQDGRGYTGLPINHVIIVDFAQFKERDRRARRRSRSTSPSGSSPSSTARSRRSEAARLEGLALREGRAAHERQARARSTRASARTCSTRPTRTSRAPSASRTSLQAIARGR